MKQLFTQCDEKVKLEEKKHFMNRKYIIITEAFGWEMRAVEPKGTGEILNTLLFLR